MAHAKKSTDRKIQIRIQARHSQTVQDGPTAVNIVVMSVSYRSSQFLHVGRDSDPQREVFTEVMDLSATLLEQRSLKL